MPNMRFRGPVILDEDEERKLEDRTAELAQLILYLQNRKKNCTKVSNIRMWVQCIDQTIGILDEIIGVKICFFKNQKLINSSCLLEMLCIFILNCVCKTKTSQGYRLYVKNTLKIQHETSDENSCYSDEDKAKYGLLIAILMFIYMMHRPGSLNYTVSENSLKNFLKEMGITENSCFGNQVDLNKLFGASPTAEFISQGWLAFTKEMDESGHDIITYEWGPRAKSFIDPMAILRAYSTMDGSTLHNWRLHYQEPQTAAARNGRLLPDN
uniref:MAGE domain-containing protein n=1 Tax=Onchocerca volvulus TaxID=6282 RepID=A0A8R1TQ79_ONCVO